jgi:hypothetical protein
MEFPKLMPISLVRKSIRLILARDGDSGFMRYLMEQTDNYSVKDGKKFDNAEAEVDDLIKNIPEIKQLKVSIVEFFKDVRIKNGLEA